ncbi:cornifelin homolog B-like [Synchiropus splendidus]|uniref:cornifelin homolog B-like n=1 Tax=Synchiropus splendidus TaxID=270530 RepID=UPI00237E5F81|nr:cornifelin homolog B-like [Synchiropus splendidus]
MSAALWPVTSQPSQPSLDLSAEWSSGICDCCDDKSECCLVCCCCPCFACATSRKLGECLCLPLVDVLGCVPSGTLSVRVSVRHRYGIQGSLCRDCVCATCCLPCVWCQISREMKSRELPAVLGDIIGRR